jgi:hypothetical protein
MAVPLSFKVIIGSAIPSEVASSATASVIMHMEMKAKMKPLVSLKTGSSGSMVGPAVKFEWLPDWERGDISKDLFSAIGASKVIFLGIAYCSLERCSGKEQMLKKSEVREQSKQFLLQVEKALGEY